MHVIFLNGNNLHTIASVFGWVEPKLDVYIKHLLTSVPHLSGHCLHLRRVLLTDRCTLAQQELATQACYHCRWIEQCAQ